MSGRVRQWMESYDHSGKVNRVHPKNINGQSINSLHYPPTFKELEKMNKWSGLQNRFFKEIKKLLTNNCSRECISKMALDMMHSSINWRQECRELALDLIYSIEPQFEMTDNEILAKIRKLDTNTWAQMTYPFNNYPYEANGLKIIYNSQAKNMAYSINEEVMLWMRNIKS